MNSGIITTVAKAVRLDLLFLLIRGVAFSMGTFYRDIIACM